MEMYQVRMYRNQRSVMFQGLYMKILNHRYTL